jgi:hypothetical protein
MVHAEESETVISVERIEVGLTEKEKISQELERGARSARFDAATRNFLHKVSQLFKGHRNSTDTDVVEASNGDCSICLKKNESKSFFSDLLKKIGRGAAWLSTTTAKPFMTAAGFIKGSLENQDQNKELTALFQFFINHQEDFDDLYLKAGTPEDMINLMLIKMEEIMERKSRIIMKDFLLQLGISREIPEDLSKFELTPEEIAAIDQSKISVDLINNHPEYREVRNTIGAMTQQDLVDIITSGHFNKSISFDLYKDSVPSVPELVGTVVGQIFAPQIALGVISNSLAGLYATPVVLADIGTGVSAAVCLEKETQSQFETDQDLKMFCSYVTNRSAYQLMKSRAKGYVAGKKFNQKVKDKIRQMREKRARKKEQELKEQRDPEERKPLQLDPPA